MEERNKDSNLNNTLEKEKDEREKERERIEREIEKEKERIEKIPYEGKFEKKEYIINKIKSELNENSSIKCTFRIKNTSKEKKWEKGFSIKMNKYKNEDNIHIIEGDKIEDVVDLYSIINKNITFYIGDLEKNNYKLEIYLCDDKNNKINNCSTKLIINIIDNENNSNIKLNDNEIEELYNNLNEEYNIENCGVNIDLIKKWYIEYSKTIDDNISKDKFIEELKDFVIDKIL